MRRQLYVTTKKFKNGPYLLGILSEENGNYRFEYKWGGEVRNHILALHEFPNVCKVYEGAEVERFVNRLIPHKESIYIEDFLQKANLKEYDAWELLKAYGRVNMNDDAFLYETLPEGTILYEELG